MGTHEFYVGRNKRGNSLIVRMNDAEVERMKRDVERLKAKAEAARIEIGDKELNRRYKAMREEWRDEAQAYREYKEMGKDPRYARMRKAPNPHHDFVGWLKWKREALNVAAWRIH